MATPHYSGTSWAAADEFLKGRNRGRGADDAVIAGHTRLQRERPVISAPRADIVVKHWGTVLVRYHAPTRDRRDGTVTVHPYNSVTSKARINNYSPASVYSISGDLMIWHRATDPTTPAKLIRCSGEVGERTYSWPRVAPSRYQCHNGTVRRQRTRSLPCELGTNCPYETNRDYGRSWQERDQDRTTGRVATWTTEHSHYRPIGIRSEPCQTCGGTGYRDIGSKVDPVTFDQDRTVDHTGRVLQVRPSDRFYVGKARRKAEAKARTVRQAREHARRLRSQVKTSDGKRLFFKGVTASLSSPIQVDQALTYAPGAMVDAGEFDADPMTDCGAGINFARTVDGAARWISPEYRRGGGAGGVVVSVTVPKGEQITNAGIKSRARRVRVGAVVATVNATGDVTPWQGFVTT